MCSNHSFVCSPHDKCCITPGTHTETANADIARCLQIDANPLQSRESNHYQFECLTQLEEARHRTCVLTTPASVRMSGYVANSKAGFWSSSFLQAEGLEGESKATTVIASNVYDSCCTICYPAFAVTTTCMIDPKSTALIATVNHVSQHVRMQRKCHARWRCHFGTQVKDVVLK